MELVMSIDCTAASTIRIGATDPVLNRGLGHGGKDQITDGNHGLAVPMLTVCTHTGKGFNIQKYCLNHAVGEGLRPSPTK